MKSRTHQLSAGRGTYVLLGAVVLVSLFPLYWSVVAASNDQAGISKSPPDLVPGTHLLDNLRRMLDLVDMRKALVNSFVVSATVTVSVVLTATLAGFALAKLRFRGRHALLAVIVATMMVPTQLGIIPLYLMMAKWFGWVDQLQALILPGAVTAFGVFFMRQYLVTALPTELIEAARVDGCSTLRTYWNVVLPVARPAAAVLGMLTFMNTWNDFYWPLLVLTPQNPTVQVALSSLAGGYVTDYPLVLAGALVGIVPILIVFAVLGRQILDGIMQGALKA
ncbi:MAG: carbohydrate ABC transporter permease [Actinobacteria bacterium]|nr:MAG: carbohydrate ABC transporter permease [Actinomycetota bacterium]